MKRSQDNRLLFWFAAFTAVATVCLIGIGGLVTSHGAGMAVPDWPTSYGYNMFALPFSYWIGGVFYEHSHRLVASFVGFLTMILAAWLWAKEERRWLRWLGVIALVAVIVQGVLGGLRVTLFKQELGIFHATLAQLFLLLVSFIAFALSRTWKGLVAQRHTVSLHPWLRPLMLGCTLLILGQLVIGATMRHQHAGLAVPDFPLAYGELWPRTDPAFIEEVNARRLDARDFAPITAAQIHLHMAHRITAVVILLGVFAVTWLIGRGETTPGLRRGTYIWSGMILAQAALGAFTVLTNKAADVATAHVVLGALSLLYGGMLSVIAIITGKRKAVVEPSLGLGRAALTS